jgi:type IV pilus assembly protein PilO
MDINEIKKNTFEYLLKTSLRDKLLILFGSLIVPVALFGGLYVYPFFDKKIALEKSIVNLKGEVTNLEIKQKTIELIKSENREMEKILAQAMTLLPEKEQIPELVTEISDIGSSETLEIIKVTPEKEKIEEFYAMIPFSLNIKGQFHSIVSFFSRVMMMSRIVNINDYKITKLKFEGQRMTVTVDCKAATYRFLTPEEIKAQEEAKAAAAAKK